MREIPDDIRESAEFVVNKFAAMFPFGEWSSDQVGAVSMISMNEERNRCLSILKSIEPMNPSEAHLIETIVRRIRGSE